MTSKENNELKSIKYKSNIKTPILSNKIEDDLDNLDKFLEKEKNISQDDNWGKMDKNTRLLKLNQYAMQYKEEKGMNEEEYNKLLCYFKECVDKKKLSKIKDVIYDKKTNTIKEVPGLMLNKQNNYTIKNLDAKNATLKCLQSKKTCKKVMSPKQNL